MSKHVKTLSVIGSAIASWSNTVEAAAITRKALAAQCEKLTLIEKQRVDEELVSYYATQAGVGVKQREKASAKFCHLVPVWPLNAKGKPEHPAMMALSRARGVLFGTKKASPQKAAPKFTMETLLPGVGAFIESMNGEKINAAQKRDVRQAAALLLSLVA